LKRTALLLALVLAPVKAQDAKLPNVKLVQLKHIETGTAIDLLAPFMTNNSPVRIHSARGTRLLSVSGAPEAITLVEEFIKKFDVAPAPGPPPRVPKNVEVIAYMLLGSDEPESADQVPPAELSGVVKQLRGMFPFKTYRLAETMIIRGREHAGGTAAGIARDNRLFEFKYGGVSIDGEDKARTIHLNNVRLGAKVPYLSAGAVQHIDTGISTNVDIREGQKVVVGKTSLGQGQSSMFLVISARVVE